MAFSGRKFKGTVRKRDVQQTVAAVMRGKIIKGIAGFYYVHTAQSGVYQCRAKGIFRNRKMKPLVGDIVEIDVLDETEKEGNVIEIAARKNELLRPSVANIDQALLIFAAARSKTNFNLLDRFLAQMRCQQIPAVICFNKTDLISGSEQEELKSMYRGSGSPVLFASNLAGKDQRGVRPVRRWQIFHSQLFTKRSANGNGGNQQENRTREKHDEAFAVNPY